MNTGKIKYIVTIQCHIVKERCSGYICESTFNAREGLFERYKENKDLRFLSMTCGGCCGRAVHRKMIDLLKTIKRKEKITKDEIAVHFSSCIVTENYHGYPCTHKEYLKKIITEKLGMQLVEGTYISKLAEKRREQGIYNSND